MTTATAYHARIARVLDHIDRHLDEPLDLDRLSAVAACSKYHFHRQFAAMTGVSLHRYVQLARLKRAAFRLAYRDGRVIEIALDSGYAAPDAFARAFRKRLGQSPTAFRDDADWASWHMAFGPLHLARSMTMPRNFDPAAVAIRDTTSVRVAILSHRGDPATIGATIQRFIAWRRASRLPPARSATYNIFHTDPHTGVPEVQRIDLCAATDRSIDPKGEAIVEGTIPGGRCAVLRVVGDTDDLEPAATFLYRDWLPDSGEEPGDFPLYCRRLSFFPDVPAHEAVAELFLPLR